jgi:glutamine amidotransferase
MSPYIVIVDYGMGNLHSVKKMLDRMKAPCLISSHPEDIKAAHKIILPGVGHFLKAMTNLNELKLLEPLHEAALVEKKPILGICLGMQLMTRHSEEGDCDGLGWFDAELVKFSVSDRIKYKVPHMGWNQIAIKKSSALMADIDDLSEFYFVHSYHLKAANTSDVLNETEYDEVFPSAIEKGNLFGVQYHPEKSHDAGAQLLKNFIGL